MYICYFDDLSVVGCADLVCYIPCDFCLSQFFSLVLSVSVSVSLSVFVKKMYGCKPLT